MVSIREIGKMKVPVLVLEMQEYLHTPDNCQAAKYKIFYNGEELHDVTGVIRVNRTDG